MVSALFHRAEFWLLSALSDCLMVRLCSCARKTWFGIITLYLKNLDRLHFGSCSYIIIIITFYINIKCSCVHTSGCLFGH
jgi:hypothetical protein